MAKYDNLKKYITSPTNPKFFIHFSINKRLGLNYGSKDTNPFGYYSYPLTETIHKQLVDNSLPWASDRPYIIVFSNSRPILDTALYTEDDLKRDSLSLKYLFGSEAFSNKSEMERIKRFAGHHGDRSAAVLWALTEFIANKDAKKWRKIFLELGYSGVTDQFGIIHPYEPTQAVMFENDALIFIDIVLNSVKNINKTRLKEVSTNKHELNLLSIQKPFSHPDIRLYDTFKNSDKDKKILQYILTNYKGSIKNIYIINEFLKEDSYSLNKELNQSIHIENRVTSDYVYKALQNVTILQKAVLLGIVDEIDALHRSYYGASIRTYIINNFIKHFNQKSVIKKLFTMLNNEALLEKVMLEIIKTICRHYDIIPEPQVLSETFYKLFSFYGKEIALNSMCLLIMHHDALINVVDGMKIDEEFIPVYDLFKSYFKEVLSTEQMDYVKSHFKR